MKEADILNTQNDKPKPKHPAIIYLRQYAYLKLRRDDLRDELMQIRENATRATSRMTAERVSGTSARDSMANAAVKAVGVEKRLETTIRNLEEALNIRVWLIEQMKDEREKTLLIERYISGRSWEEIQRRLFLSKTAVFKAHGYALQNFWEIYSRQNEKVD